MTSGPMTVIRVGLSPTSGHSGVDLVILARRFVVRPGAPWEDDRERWLGVLGASPLVRELVARGVLLVEEFELHANDPLARLKPKAVQ